MGMYETKCEKKENVRSENLKSQIRKNRAAAKKVRAQKNNKRKNETKEFIDQIVNETTALAVEKSEAMWTYATEIEREMGIEDKLPKEKDLNAKKLEVESEQLEKVDEKYESEID